MSTANWGIWGGGGGLNIFFRGRNVHQGKFKSFSGSDLLTCMLPTFGPPTI